MSSGTYEAVVHCPACNHSFAVTVEWWYSYGSREIPPEGETNMRLSDGGADFPDNCPNCGVDFVDTPSPKTHYEVMLECADSQRPCEPDPFEGFDSEDISAELYAEYPYEPEAETRHQGPDQ